MFNKVRGRIWKK
jgi:hypothetical protein